MQPTIIKTTRWTIIADEWVEVPTYLIRNADGKVEYSDRLSARQRRQFAQQKEAA